MGLFTPAWKKNDSKSVTKAIESIAKAENQVDLARIATEAPSFQVRRAAVKKLTEQNILAQIVIHDAAVADDALERINDSAALSIIMRTDQLSAHRIKAASKLQDHKAGQQFIGDAAMHDKEEAVRLQAIQLLDDQEILADIAIAETKSYQAAMGAVRRVTDSALLAKIARNGKNGSARSFALSKISDSKLKEEISKELLAEPKAGSDIWQTAIELTDDQAAIMSLIRNPNVHNELKFKAIRKLTNKEYLNEIIQSKDNTFVITTHTFSASGSEGISSKHHLKPYAEAQLSILDKKS